MVERKFGGNRMSGKPYPINYWEIVGKTFVSVILGTVLGVLLVLIFGVVYSYFGNNLPPDQDARSTFQAVDTFYTGCFLLPLQIVLLTLFSFLALYFNRFLKTSPGKVFALAGLAEFFTTLVLTWSWGRWLASNFDESLFAQFEFILLVVWYLSIPLVVFFLLLVIPYWRAFGNDTSM